MGALAQGRNLPIDVTIHDLERHAPRWVTLVPESVALRAALAQLMSQKYPLTYPQIPQIRQALGLGQADVQEAFEQAQQRPIDSIYLPQPSLRQQLEWLQAQLAWRLEDLPPFWTAFALTFTETVGASTLVLTTLYVALTYKKGVVERC